ncbi:MAG: aminopeptidase P family protein [Chloroflexi bacterium]|nr:aminopeptidase P family protein [Chloroflexota bacterium]
MNNDRLQQLQTVIAQAGLDGAAFNPGPTLAYLTGQRFHRMERPVVLLAGPSGQPAMVLPALETGRLELFPYPVQAFPYGDNPASWDSAFQQAARFLGWQRPRLAVEANQFRVLELNFLQKAFPGLQPVPADEQLGALRLHKDAQEVALMRTAVKIAQQALLATLPSIHPGVSELEIAAELTIQLLRAGSEPELPFAPIVASGPNSANPHATPTERKVAPGDLIVIDWGGIYQGYISDLTRTLAVGEIDPELAQIHAAVALANRAGRQAGKPGVPAGTVDHAARGAIQAAGYGAYFTHRTGHGIGMEAHEPPYMYAENDLILEPGMAYTVEPGIYLPGKGGVRIEDNVVVTADGVEVLSDLPRHLFPIPVTAP